MNEAQQAIAMLNKAIQHATDVFEKLEAKIWPKKGDQVYAITGRGKVICGQYGYSKIEERDAFLGVFRTEEEAHRRIDHVKRLLGKPL